MEMHKGKVKEIEMYEGEQKKEYGKVEMCKENKARCKNVSV